MVSHVKCCTLMCTDPRLAVAVQYVRANVAVSCVPTRDQMRQSDMWPPLEFKQEIILYLGQRKRNMYKDAGVMGEKIRSNISNNPMMTSPSFGSSIPSASMFQPTFQPGSENGNTQPETQTQVR